MTQSPTWWNRVLTGGDGSLRRSRAGSERYLVLPGVDDPRVLVDMSSRAALVDALDRSSATSGHPEIARRALAAVAPYAARGRVWSVDADGRGLRDHLQAVLGPPVALSISVGPPRPNRKPVVRCWLGDALVAVAKLGIEPHTRRMVDNEADWLRRLEVAPFDDLITPRIRHRGQWAGGTLLVTDALPLSSEGPVGAVLDHMPGHVLTQVADRVADGPGDPRRWWVEFTRRLDAAAACPEVSDAIALVDGDRSLDDLELSFAHGDWSPFNVGTTPNGSICVWDWERATLAAPPGFDALHLRYQYGDGRLSSSEHPLTPILYLLEMVARLVESGGSDLLGGHRIVADLRALLSREVTAT